jgi:hypothetical protein
MMNSYSNLKDNWILEAEHSDKVNTSEIEKILMDSINSQINENKELLNDNETNYRIELNKLNILTPQISKKPYPKYKNYISKSQNWIGYVISIDKETFSAKLEDINNPTTYEIAEFELNDISPGDLNLLKLGAIFYWSVGFGNQNGQHIKQSFIRFKRAALIHEEEFDKLMDEADNIYKNLTWD